VSLLFGKSGRLRLKSMHIAKVQRIYNAFVETVIEAVATII
jgi:hypothetical protein